MFYPPWYLNWLRVWREEANPMDGYHIRTNEGIVVVPANHQNGQALVNWVHWVQGTVNPDEDGDVIVNQLFAPNGRTVAYLLDLRNTPERIEERLFSCIEQAKKAGDTPSAVAWLTEKKFTDL